MKALLLIAALAAGAGDDIYNGHMDSDVSEGRIRGKVVATTIHSCNARGSKDKARPGNCNGTIRLVKSDGKLWEAVVTTRVNVNGSFAALNSLIGKTVSVDYALKDGMVTATSVSVASPKTPAP